MLREFKTSLTNPMLNIPFRIATRMGRSLEEGLQAMSSPVHHSTKWLFHHLQPGW
jgi:hypothetical protein